MTEQTPIDSIFTEMPADLIAATVWRAEHSADLVAQFLKWSAQQASGPDGASRPLALSAVELLELAAFFQICEWEQVGVLKHLGADVLDSNEAAKLLAPSDTASSSILDSKSLPLTFQVMAAHTYRLTWRGPELLGTEVVLEGSKDEHLIDAFADYLWNTRNSKDTFDETT